MKVYINEYKCKKYIYTFKKLCRLMCTNKKYINVNLC